MSTLNVDNINEYTSGNGVEIPGHILQVVSATDTTAASYTLANTNTKAGSLEVSITPKATSSKVFLMASIALGGASRYNYLNFYFLNVNH